MQEEEWEMGKIWNVSSFITSRGDTLSAGTLNNGSGIKLNYYAEGNIEISCEFQQGVPHGNWKYYYQNGKVGEEGVFENVVKMGNWKFYYRNGKQESIGAYSNDKKTGSWIYFSKSGSILDKIDEDSGKSLMN